MRKLLFIPLILPMIVFTQSNELQNDISKILKNNKGFLININPAVSYFGNSVKTHWEIEAGWLSEAGNGVTVGLEGIFDSKTFDNSISSYRQQSAFLNLEFLSTEIWNNNANKSGISFGWLIKDDANIFHKGGNVDCFRVKISTSLGSDVCIFGAYYFDKDDGTGQRHDVPSIGLSYGI